MYLEFFKIKSLLMAVKLFVIQIALLQFAVCNLQAQFDPGDSNHCHSCVYPNSAAKLSSIDTCDFSPNNAKSNALLVVNNHGTESDLSWIKYPVIGAVNLVVAVAAFLISQNYSRRKDVITERKRYLSVLMVLAREIKMNLDFECQQHAYIYVNLMPTFGLSLVVPEFYYKELVQLCSDDELMRRVFHQYHEYRHIQDRIDHLVSLSRSLDEKLPRAGSVSGSDTRELSYESNKGGTLELIRANINGSFELYNMISTEMTELDSLKAVARLSDSYLSEKYEEFQKNTELLILASRSGVDFNGRPKFD